MRSSDALALCPIPLLVLGKLTGPKPSAVRDECIMDAYMPCQPTTSRHCGRLFLPPTNAGSLHAWSCPVCGTHSGVLLQLLLWLLLSSSVHPGRMLAHSRHAFCGLLLNSHCLADRGAVPSCMLELIEGETSLQFCQARAQSLAQTAATRVCCEAYANWLSCLLPLTCA